MKYRNEIRGPTDLRGRPVGVTAPGSATDLLTRCMLSKEGVRPEEMKIIGMGTNTIIPAIENDQMVLRWAWNPKMDPDRLIDARFVKKALERK